VLNDKLRSWWAGDHISCFACPTTTFIVGAVVGIAAGAAQAITIHDDTTYTCGPVGLAITPSCFACPTTTFIVIGTAAGAAISDHHHSRITYTCDLAGLAITPCFACPTTPSSSSSALLLALLR
jgi:hypothetical protein